jgi:hypothetical protein
MNVGSVAYLAGGGNGELKSRPYPSWQATIAMLQLIQVKFIECQPAMAVRNALS